MEFSGKAAEIEKFMWVFKFYAILLLLSRRGGSKGGGIPFWDSSKIRVCVQPSQQPCLATAPNSQQPRQTPHLDDLSQPNTCTETAIRTTWADLIGSIWCSTLPAVCDHVLYADKSGKLHSRVPCFLRGCQNMLISWFLFSFTSMPKFILQNKRFQTLLFSPRNPTPCSIFNP